MKPFDQPGDHFTRSYVPAQGTAGTANSWAVFRAPKACTVTGIAWVPNAAVTGAATNNFALGAVNKGAAAAGTTAVTTVKTYASGTNSAASVAEALTLSSTAADLNMAAGDVLALVRTVNGTGLASPDGHLEISFRYR